MLTNLRGEKMKKYFVLALISLTSLTAFAGAQTTDLCKNPLKAAAIKHKISTSFNAFTGTNVEILEKFYTQDVDYMDPISTVKGLDNVKKLLAKTYQNVQMLKYNFFDFICENNKVSASYNLDIQIAGLNSGNPYVVKGTSVFHITQDGLIAKHRDYFDLGSMVYEKHPLTGVAIKSIKSALGKH